MRVGQPAEVTEIVGTAGEPTGIGHLAQRAERDLGATATAGGRGEQRVTGQRTEEFERILSGIGQYRVDRRARIRHCDNQSRAEIGQPGRVLGRMGQVVDVGRIDLAHELHEPGETGEQAGGEVQRPVFEHPAHIRDIGDPPVGEWWFLGRLVGSGGEGAHRDGGTVVALSSCAAQYLSRLVAHAGPGIDQRGLRLLFPGERVPPVLLPAFLRVGGLPFIDGVGGFVLRGFHLVVPGLHGLGRRGERVGGVEPQFRLLVVDRVERVRALAGPVGGVDLFERLAGGVDGGGHLLQCLCGGTDFGRLAADEFLGILGLTELLLVDGATGARGYVVAEVVQSFGEVVQADILRAVGQDVQTVVDDLAGAFDNFLDALLDRIADIVDDIPESQGYLPSASFMIFAACSDAPVFQPGV
nr:hypothetical protein [Nocardia suismassiliense]